MPRDHRLCGALALASVLFATSAKAAPTWTLHGTVAEGGQLDAAVDPSGRVHVVSSRYYQLDASATVLVDEAQGDGRQGALDFPPAIAVGDDGSAHIVTRHGGDWSSGHDIRYRRRNAQGSWDRDYLFGSAVPRNYVVAAAWADGASVYVAHSAGGQNVWGDLHLFTAGASAATPVGTLTGLWRADADFRLRGRAGRVHLVSGLPDPDGKAFFASANAGAGLGAALQSAAHEHTAGAGRRGFPDLHAAESGDVLMSYGAQNRVYYARHASQGSDLLGSDVLVFDGLGDWHLATGLSAVAGHGDIVLIVALDSDGSQQAADADLLWAYSTDGGASWSAPEDLGVNTDGGEGRRRPRLVVTGDTFMLLYWDNATSGLAAATVVIAADADSDGYPADEDCNDADATVYPGATEECNGVDDDCDDAIDEGCGAPPDGGGSPAGGAGGAGATGTGGSNGGASGEPAASSSELIGGCECTLPPGTAAGGEPVPWSLVALLLLAALRAAAPGGRTARDP